MISPRLLEILDGLPPGTLPIAPTGPLVTERTTAPSVVRIEQFDWEGYADVVLAGEQGPFAIVVVTECGPSCVQTILPVVRTGDVWVAGPPAPGFDPELVENLYRTLTGEGWDEPGGVPVMVAAQDDGRLLVVTQAHLGAATATLGELIWEAGPGWRFAPAITS